MATCIHCGVESASPFLGDGEPYCSERCYQRSLELKSSYRLLDAAYRSTIEVLVTALDARECETNRHSQRVAGYSRFMGEKMGITGADLDTIERGALLHDIGKIGIPDAILLKPGKLNENEWRVMRTHPEIGHRILSNCEFLQPACEIVLSHEERFDGLGYPRGLKGDAIPLGARIFAVMDTLDAMAFDRPYRKALPFDLVLAEVMKHSGSQFDPAVVEVFTQNAVTFGEWVQRDWADACEIHL